MYFYETSKESEKEVGQMCQILGLETAKGIFFPQVSFLCQCLSALICDTSTQQSPTGTKLTRRENLIHLCQPFYQTLLCLMGYSLISLETTFTC